MENVSINEYPIFRAQEIETGKTLEFQVRATMVETRVGPRVLLTPVGKERVLIVAPEVLLQGGTVEYWGRKLIIEQRERS